MNQESRQTCIIFESSGGEAGRASRKKDDLAIRIAFCLVTEKKKKKYEREQSLGNKLWDQCYKYL